MAVQAKGRDALESYRLARYLMHAQVYKHKTRLAADSMLIRAVQLACEREQIDAAPFTFKENDQAFLDAYLKHDAKAKQWLTQTAPTYLKAFGTYEMKTGK